MPKLNIALVSDFRDYYDHWFDAILRKSPIRKFDYVLNRNSVDGMLKRQQFELLEKAGFWVPEHGLVRDVYKKLDPEEFDYLVVYTDEAAHCGEGKILQYSEGAIKHNPDLYCSKFIRTTQAATSRATSHRTLVVGDREFQMRYRSYGSWQSNHAKEVVIEDIYESKVDLFKLDRRLFRKYPIFAIDLVSEYNKEGQLPYAIDFNSAPGLKGTGIEDILPAKECAEAIYEYVEREGLCH